MDDLYLGLDLATAGARLVAITSQGRVVAEHSTSLPKPVSPAAGHVEQQAGYLDAAVRLLGATTADLGPQASARIRALSMTGTSGTVVPTDAAGRPVGPAVLYDDQRAGAQAQRLTAAGIPATATSPMARIGWLQRHAPAARYLHTPDVVAAGLLKDLPPTDTSHALKAGIDPVAATWDTSALAAVDVPADALPGLVHPGTVLGTVDREVAAACGLPAGVSLVAGMTDGCTAQIAAGAVRPGDTVGVLGTTLVLKAVSEHSVSGFGGAVYSHYSPDGLFWAGGASNVGARLVRAEFGDRDLDELERLAAAHGPADAVRYPLPGTGERFPFSRADARGFTIGSADGVAAYRTLLEGVAFVERLGLEVLQARGVRLGDHRLAGGGSGNRLWNRVRATVLDRPVTRLEHASSGYGAALLAVAAATGAGLAVTVDRTERTEEVFEPDPAQAPRLADSYARMCHELTQRGYLGAAGAQT